MNDQLTEVYASIDALIDYALVVLSDIEKLTKEKEKATKKLAYLEKKLSGEK